MTVIQPPQLPLSRDQLADALQKGLGRALMHATRFGLHGDELLLTHAATHHLAYDPQCEGERAPWVVRIAAACGLESTLAEAVAAAIHSPSERYWDAAHQCQIARELARTGSLKAKDALYASLRPSPESADIIGAREIITLDGADGLIHVAATIGGWLAADRAMSAPDDPISEFDSQHGDGAGRRILEAARSSSPAVNRYLTSLDESLNHSDDGRIDLNNVRPAASGQVRYRKQDLPVDIVLAEIRDEDPTSNRYWFSQWGRYATEADLAQVQEALRLESNAGRIAKLLRVFTYRAMPSLSEAVLQLSEHPDEEVRRRLFRALGNMSDSEIRTLAISRLNQGKAQDGEIRLFESTYRAGDEQLINRILQIPGGPEDVHTRVFDAVQVFEANITAASQDSMLLVYERSPCSNCRHYAVKMLIRTRTAPPWLLEECQYDADDDIRSQALAAML